MMWAAVALSLALFAVLDVLGWGDSAASIAGGLLLLSCASVCIWAGMQGRKAEREVDRAIGQIVNAPHRPNRRSR